MDRLKLFENLNEDFFKSVLDHMFEGIQIIDNDWRYVYVNDAAASHGRRPKSEIIGKTMMEVYPGIENTEVFSRMKQCLEKSTPTQMENRFEYPDKKIGWFQLSIEPTVAGLLIRSIDISKVKQSEDFFRVAVDAAPNAMIMVNSRGKIVLANKMAEQLFGYSFAELLQMIVDQLVPIRTQGEHPQLREEFMRNPSARAMGSNRDLFCLTKDGKEVPVEIGLTPVHLDEELYVISSIVDIRERKRAEENIHRQTKELERINGELEEFFYVAAHDLRAPLRHISSFTSLLKEHMANGGDEKANKWLQYVIDGTERMRMLLDDLMHYSQAD